MLDPAAPNVFEGAFLATRNQASGAARLRSRPLGGWCRRALLGCGCWRRGDERVFCGFFGLEDCAARAAHSLAGFESFRAQRAFHLRPRIVEPGLLDAEDAGGAAVEVGDEERRVRTLPFEIRRGDESAVERFELGARLGELFLGGFVTGADEYAVKTSLPRVGIDFAREVFGNRARRDGKFRGAFVAEVNAAGAVGDLGERVSLAGRRCGNFNRAEIGAMPRRPFFGSDVAKHGVVW